MKSKKSGIPILSALLRIIIAIVLVVLFFKVSTRTLYAFSDKDDKVVASFEEFANFINDMSVSKSFEIELKKGSAIIGFKKSSIDWQCFNCYTSNPPQPARVYIRPSNNQCISSACLCLCLEGFELSSTTKLGKCQNMICKELKKDIKETTIIKSSDNKYDAGDTYWKNGFLFANSVHGANGLEAEGGNIQLFVNNENGIISVCNTEMKVNNEPIFGSGGCAGPK